MHEISKDLKLKLELSRREQIVHVSRLSHAAILCTQMFILLPLIGYAFLLVLRDESSNIIGLVLGGFVAFVLLGTHLIRSDRLAILTSHRVIFSDPLQNELRSVQLSNIQKMTCLPRSLIIHTESNGDDQLELKISDKKRFVRSIKTLVPNQFDTIEGYGGYSNKEYGDYSNVWLGLAIFLTILVTSFAYFVNEDSKLSTKTTHEDTSTKSTRGQEYSRSDLSSEKMSSEIQIGRNLWSMICVFIDAGVSPEKAVLETGAFVRRHMSLQQMHHFLEASKRHKPSECDGIISQ